MGLAGTLLCNLVWGIYVSWLLVLKCRHLTTVENRLADLLSKWDLHSTISEEFLNHAQNNAWSEVIVEDELFLFSAPW